MSGQALPNSRRPVLEGARISVVVPSFNHARFIRATLRSVLRQRLAPSELLVIDDGSTDGSPRVIEQALNDCPFPCELLVRPNRGLCATLNEGLARTSGRFFGYLGSDDLWLQGFLEERVRMLETRPRAVLGYGHTYLVDEQNRIIDCTCDWAKYADGDARGMLLKTIGPMSPTVLYRRNALERHGWNPGSKLEDYELYLRLSEDGDFAFDPQVLSAWRQHKENTSWDQMMMLREQLEAQRRVLKNSGMSADDLERLQTQIRFNRAEDFLRIGEKAAALRLMFHNLGGVTSARSFARMLIRLVVPFSLVRRRKERLRRLAGKRYGSIQI